MTENIKIIHRTYFNNFSSDKDPFEKYLEGWLDQMPTYRIHLWNETNIDIYGTEWLKKATEENAPVFLSEAIRWKVLSDFGGLYLDADCQIVNGVKLHTLLEELYLSDDYDAFCGVEDFHTGIPTAQTVAAKKGSELVAFMDNLYTNFMRPFWPWRETHNMLGPHLMSLYFYEKGWRGDEGYFKNITEPIIVGRVKIYPQDYFSPKFGIDGDVLKISKNTCVYHLFANMNVEFKSQSKLKIRSEALTLNEYQKSINLKASNLDSSNTSSYLRSDNGELIAKRMVRFAIKHPRRTTRMFVDLLKRGMNK